MAERPGRAGRQATDPAAATSCCSAILVFAERLTDFAQRLAEGEVQMGRGIGRAADAAAAELQVANKMAAKINNDAVADVERLLIKLLRRADGIPPPAVQRSWFSDGLDDVPAASGAGVAARASGRPHAAKKARMTDHRHAGIVLNCL